MSAAVPVMAALRIGRRRNEAYFLERAVAAGRGLPKVVLRVLLAH